MNEEFAVEPVACSDLLEIRLLHGNFGLFAGRYIACFPKRWLRMVHDNVESWPDGINKAEAKRLLELANKEKAFVGSGGRPFNPECSWIDNVDTVQASSAPFDEVLAHPSHGDRYPSFLTFDFWRGGDFKIPGTAAAIIDVCRHLIDESPELALVDPYLNPCIAKWAKVLRALLDRLATRKTCKRVDVWISDRNLDQTKPHGYKRQQFRAALNALANAAGFPPQAVRLFIVQEETLGPKGGEEFFHARHLISIHGALTLDYGFEEIKGHARGHIVGRQAHDELVKIYLEGNFDPSSVIGPL